MNRPASRLHTRLGGGDAGRKKSLFANSIVGSDGNRWTKVGTGKKAVYHRFFKHKDNTWHWSGSTVGKTKAGVDNKIQETTVPAEIKRLNE
jgi:hypothetical protein